MDRPDYTVDLSRVATLCASCGKVVPSGKGCCREVWVERFTNKGKIVRVREAAK